MFVPVQAEALPLPAPFYSFLHVLCVLRALQRTQNTQNMYKNYKKVQPEALPLAALAQTFA